MSCFYTVKEDKKNFKGKADRWFCCESEDEDEELFYEERFIEKHYVALPSIIFSNSENPRHKLHVNCLVNPPLTNYQKKKVDFQEEVLIGIDK